MSITGCRESLRAQEERLYRRALERMRRIVTCKSGVAIAGSASTLGLCFVLLLAATACNRKPPIIAVIPRTCGTPLWEPEHAGAAAVARSSGLEIYWNGPMQEDDIQTQIALVEKALARKYRGLIVSPIETLPMQTPIRSALAGGTPVVVLGTELGILPAGKLAYVLNDEEAGGAMAARRVGVILHGQGSIAILGIDPRLTSILVRQRSFEHTLAREFPLIHVDVRRLGSSNVPAEQQIAEELLSNRNVNAIVSLSLASTRGAYYALVEFGKERTIKLVGFDQDLLLPIRTGGIDSVVAQDTYKMGQSAMSIIDGQLRGIPQPGRLLVQPVLMTRDNIDSPETHQLLNIAWWPQR